MRIDLALFNIINNPQKTALSVAGIGVAVLLVFMQLGFRGAVEDTATSIYGKLDFDVLVRSPEYLHFVDANQISLSVRDEVSSLKGVDHIKTLFVSIVNWRNHDGELKGILLIGVDPNNSPFRDRKIDKMIDRLTSKNAMLIDKLSSKEFGPKNKMHFNENDIGARFELSDRQMEIVGLFTMGAGLAANGAAIVSEETFRRLVPTASDTQVSLLLVNLKDNVDTKKFIDQVRSSRVSQSTSKEYEMLTKAEVTQLELNRWIGETPIGFIFGMGVVTAILVGAAIVYSVLGNDVTSRLNEYATLNAMGYTNSYMATVVLRQAIYLAFFSFLPALLSAYFLYWVTSQLANIPMEMNVERIGIVLGLTLAMCGASGTLALKKLWQAEPADLF